LIYSQFIASTTIPYNIISIKLL